MTKRHLKRLAAPRSWKITRKSNTWIVRPRPSGHKQADSIPLLYVIRDILGYADSSREANKIIKEGNILIDGRPAKDPKMSIGLMDVVEIPKTKERYVVVVDKAGIIRLEPIKATETKYKLLQIRDKTIVKGGKVQLNFHDGRNLLIDPKDVNKYNTHDSILLTLKDNTIKQHVKYEKGALVFVTKGSHRGAVAKIKEIKKTRSPMPNLVTLEGNGKEFRTIEDYVIVLGKDKPLLSVMK